MAKQLIINASAAEEIRVAIIENNRLVDLDFENQSRTKHKGNIYKGIVANVEDSLEAAFIEFGDDKQGFLPLSEVRPALYPPECKGQRRPRISDVLKRGQEVIVQVTKDEIGQKGAAVTTYLSLPGRYVVLMHSDDGGGGISRKIDDESARRRAREMLSRIDVPDGMAVIIRTAGMNRPLVDLYRDLQALCESWEQIDRGGQLGRAPTLLYREPDLVVRTIRDYLSPEINKIIVDNEEEFQEVLSYFEERMPDLVDLLERHEGRQPVFEAFGIEKAIEDLFHRQVKLPSGGYLVIDQTEALVAVDVNSGRSTKEEDHEATVYKTNLEAATELARQLRLRDLGGIVVVDFIDMASRKHDRDVERAIKEAMRADRAKVKVGRISENGTLELTRQRLRQAHRLISFTSCTHCEGTGLVRDPEGLAIAAIRQIHSRLARQGERLSKLTVRLPLAVANVLNNTKRKELVELSDVHQLQLDVVADERMAGSDLRFDDERRGRAGLNAAQGVKDPRLADEGGRRRRGRGKKRVEDLPAVPAASTPPPSIGPVPTFLEEGAELEPESTERAPLIDDVVEEQTYFDDLLSEALFGDAPALALADVEAEAPVTPATAQGDAPRKKRRRRRRRGRGGEKDQAALDASEETEFEDDGADDTSSEAAATASDEPGDLQTAESDVAEETTALGDAIPVDTASPALPATASAEASLAEAVASATDTAVTAHSEVEEPLAAAEVASHVDTERAAPSPEAPVMDASDDATPAVTADAPKEAKARRPRKPRARKPREASADSLPAETPATAEEAEAHAEQIAPVAEPAESPKAPARKARAKRTSRARTKAVAVEGLEVRAEAAPAEPGDSTSVEG